MDWRYPPDADGGQIVDAYALNVDGETAWSSSLIGGYGPDWKRVLIGSLTSEGFVPEARGELALPGGAELGRCRMVARGDELHVFAENRWYKTAITSE